MQYADYEAVCRYVDSDGNIFRHTEYCGRRGLEVQVQGHASRVNTWRRLEDRESCSCHDDCDTPLTYPEHCQDNDGDDGGDDDGNDGNDGDDGDDGDGGENGEGDEDGGNGTGIGGGICIADITDGDNFFTQGGGDDVEIGVSQSLIDQFGGIDDRCGEFGVIPGDGPMIFVTLEGEVIQ